MSISTEKTVRPCTQAEQQLAADTYAFCMRHMQERFTIEFLANRARVSPTKLKMVFRRAFGAPLFAHIRKEKMYWAARKLAETNSRVIDIAEACGYDNPSKFSAAFRAVMGQTPCSYRKNKL
ncbi:MAG: AraC family transcriptional regulator [Oscillospiraceae bacterium]|nr:helix-turn-helix transcriptional regulator [Oscillospiraceae bacterium]MCR4761591.1 AraC family transcriptional regulator [Oscillospiraceae bacterium]